MRLVSIANQHSKLRFNRRELVRAIHTLDARHEVLAAPGSVLDNEGELSLVFVDDATLARLHADFLDDPTITDVITFEGQPTLGTAGEICVSADAAVRQVTPGPTSGTLSQAAVPARPRKPFDREAFSRELTLYVVHGWLHLAGYDDLQPAKKRVMRRAEAKAMTALQQAGALPDFRLRR